MNSPIDIIVPWVNPRDDKWRKSISDWRMHDFNMNDECRYRDFGIFEYNIRNMLRFCPWVHKIIIVLAYESQKESWMDRLGDKVRIVYHGDYIPQAMLPTFNSNVIEMFFHMIPGIASNFILFNDDFYVVQPTKETDFFVNNLPVDFAIPKRNWTGSGRFEQMQQNNQRIANRFHHKNTGFADFHFPIAYNKSTWLTTWNKYKWELLGSLENSRFREPHNVTHWMFRHIQLGTGKFHSFDIRKQEKYIILGDDTDKQYILDSIMSNKVVVLNEQEGLHFAYDDIKEFLQMAFKSLFSD